VQDLDFIAGKFFDYEISKDLLWLRKYFDSDIQGALLNYYMVFGNLDLFTAHTGVYADPKYIRRTLRRLRRLMTLRLKAKRGMAIPEKFEKNFELLWVIESGHYKFASTPSKYNIKDIDI